MSNIDSAVLWRALAVDPPDVPEKRREGLVFDPGDVRELAMRRLISLEAAGGELARQVHEHHEAIDWDELVLYVALPVAVRGARLGEPLLRISGGLTLPPIIAVLAQAHSDAIRLD